MEHLTLKTDLSAGATSISNLFLDYYMRKPAENTQKYTYICCGPCRADGRISL